MLLKKILEAAPDVLVSILVGRLLAPGNMNSLSLTGSAFTAFIIVGRLKS